MLAAKPKAQSVKSVSGSGFVCYAVSCVFPRGSLSQVLQDGSLRPRRRKTMVTSPTEARMLGEDADLCFEAL